MQRRAAAPAREKFRTVTGTGVFSPHPRGFGFVAFDDPHSADGHDVDSAFVTPPDAADLMRGDRVQFTASIEDGGRATVTFIKLLERTRTQIFGQVVRRDGKIVVLPDAATAAGAIQVPGRAADRMRTNTWVLYDLTQRRVVETFPDLSPAAVRALVFSRHDIATGHTAEVVDDAQTAATKPACRGDVPRTDLRNLVTFTIDGPESRDLDDAISVRMGDGSARVWVHIADVSSHVRPGSPMDQAARAFGTSTYLPGWNRPMLPPAVSEAALSLLPDVDRDALTVAFTVTPDGAVSGVELTRSRIRSDHRLTYADTHALLNGHLDVDPVWGPALRDASTVASWLGAERSRRDQIEFTSSPQRASVFVSVQTGTGEDPYTAAEFTAVEPKPSYGTEMLIERLMVAANEAVGTWLVDRGLPGVFRTHAAPSEDLAADVAAYARLAGTDVSEENADGLSALAELEQLLDGTPVQGQVVRSLLMRNTEKAIYSPVPDSHFGLASKPYLHFTSPLRRYSDLVVHRIVTAALDAEADGLGRDETATQVAGQFDDLDQLCADLTSASRTASYIESDFRRLASAIVFTSNPTGVAAAGRSGPAGSRAAQPVLLPVPVEAVVTGFDLRSVRLRVTETGLSGSATFAELPGRWTTGEERLSATSTKGAQLLVGDTVRVVATAADLRAGSVTFTVAAESLPVPAMAG